MSVGAEECEGDQSQTIEVWEPQILILGATIMWLYVIVNIATRS